MSLSSNIITSHSVENRLTYFAKKGEKYAAKGIQYDPYDRSKNVLLCFSLFRRIRLPMLSIQYINSIIYDFPVPQEYVPLASLADVLKTASQIPENIAFIITSLAGKNGSHANLIVFNKPKKRIDIFDPLGKFGNTDYGEERDLQEFIVNEFICNIDDEYTLYCETLEVGIQVADYKYSKRREGTGFCRVWVWLVVQLCSEFPNKTLREIVGNMTECADTSSINICRGFLAETREHTCKMMQNRNSDFSKLYLELREAPVQSGKARNSYCASEKMAMEYLRKVGGGK
jgi:hypothetical protein